MILSMMIPMILPPLLLVIRWSGRTPYIANARSRMIEQEVTEGDWESPFRGLLSYKDNKEKNGKQEEN